MSTHHRAGRPITILLLVTGLVATDMAAQADPLDLFVGHWDVRVETTRPEPAVVTYRERYERVLDGAFIRGETFDKSDGTSDLIVGAYDKNGKGYSFWIFSSTGDFLYLPPGKWNERKQRFTWKNPPNWDISYRTVVEFPDERTRRWTVTMRDWAGNVLVEQTGRAVRRDD